MKSLFVLLIVMCFLNSAHVAIAASSAAKERDKPEMESSSEMAKKTGSSLECNRA